MNGTYYDQINKDVILNRLKNYYKNNRERLREQAKDKYKTLSEEEKKQKKRIWKKHISQYVWGKEKKQKLKEYQKKLLRGKNVSI